MTPTRRNEHHVLSTTYIFLAGPRERFEPPHEGGRASRSPRKARRERGHLEQRQLSPAISSPIPKYPQLPRAGRRFLSRRSRNRPHARTRRRSRHALQRPVRADVGA